MNDSRRPAAWRLAAMLIAVLLLTAPAAFAQTQKLRVKLGPANVYERPRTSSDVVMVAQEGQVFDVLNREDTWYWVLLPPDGNGQRRAGYIAVYLVELISPKGPDVMARGTPALATKPSVAKSAASGELEEPRYFAGIGGGGQSAAFAFSDPEVRFSAGGFDNEDVVFSGRYAMQRSSGLDATFGLRLRPHWVLGVAYWHSSLASRVNIDARIPSYNAYGQFSPASRSGLETERSEHQGHLQMTFVIPVARRADLSIFGGPSLFYLRQDLVFAFAPSPNPYENQPIGTAYTGTHRAATFGGNAGVDLTVMVWRYFGVGLTARYARASMTLNSADGSGQVKVRLGGAQASGGLRMRF